MNEVKSPKKPLMYYYTIVLILLLVFNFVAMPWISEHQIKEVDYNPLKGYIDEIDFQALVSNEKVHSVAEIHLVNLEKLSSGVPQQMLQEISFKALPAALVEKVEVDVGPLKIGDTIRVADLPIAKDKDVDLMTDLDATVVTITEVHVKASDLTSDEEEEEAAE